MRDAFPHGKYSARRSSREFNLRDYRAFLRGDRSERPRRSSSSSRRRSRRSASAGRRPASRSSSSRRTICRPPARADVPEGCEAVRSPMTASVWQVAVEPGQRVEAGQTIVVLEAMKMEVAVVAPRRGRRRAWCTARKGSDGRPPGRTSRRVRVADDDHARLRSDYLAGAKTARIVDANLRAHRGGGLRPIWISLADRADARCAGAKTVDLSLPLAGVPFAVKDNIDVAGHADDGRVPGVRVSRRAHRDGRARGCSTPARF